VHVKVVDTGSYDLLDDAGKVVAGKDEDYVPSFFPGEHYGDYLILDIDIDTGLITNWKQPTPQAVMDAFGLGNADD